MIREAKDRPCINANGEIVPPFSPSSPQRLIYDDVSTRLDVNFFPSIGDLRFSLSRLFLEDLFFLSILISPSHEKRIYNF